MAAKRGKVISARRSTRYALKPAMPYRVTKWRRYSSDLGDDVVVPLGAGSAYISSVTFPTLILSSLSATSLSPLRRGLSLRTTERQQRENYLFTFLVVGSSNLLVRNYRPPKMHPVHFFLTGRTLLPICPLLSDFPALLDLFQHPHKQIEVGFSVFVVIALPVADDLALNRNRDPDNVFRGFRHYSAHRLDALVDVSAPASIMNASCTMAMIRIPTSRALIAAICMMSAPADCTGKFRQVRSGGWPSIQYCGQNRHPSGDHSGAAERPR